MEQFKRLAADMGAINKFYLRSKLSDLEVTLMKLTKFIDASDQGVIVEQDGNKSVISDVDTLIWSVGTISNNSLLDELKGTPYEVYIIGDAKEPRGAFSAIEEGHRLGLDI